ncbi:uncharacterized protein [Antedon mediterranea]|uniref:uncharacterized protein n=1 Tax=Antedon mediterranea TaxID=105859 RepID=UPI003AF5679A
MGKRDKKYEEAEETSSSGDEESSDSESASDSGITPMKKQRLDSTMKKRIKQEKKKVEKKEKLKKSNKISKDDYYLKSTEFRIWLKEEKRIYFDELSSSKSRYYFKKFVKMWNKGRLRKKFYDGIDTTDVSASSKTKYKWKFATTVNNKNMETVRSNIGKWSSMTSPGERTFSTFGKKAGSQLKAASDAMYGTKELQGESSGHSSRPVLGPTMPTGDTFRPVMGPTMPTGDTFRPVLGPTMPSGGLARPVQGPTLPPTFLKAQEEENREEERKRLKYERKQFKKHNNMVLEELAPRGTGHDAKIEKRIGRAESKRQRQQSPDLHDSIVMGTSSDNFQARMAARRRNREAHEEKKMLIAKQKVKDYKEKEDAKMKALLEMAKATKSKDALW